MNRIRNGVVAIDRVTTAPNSDAASGVISCAAVAIANSTKPNSPAWLSSRPRRMASCQVQLKRRLRMVIRSVLVTITPTAIPITNSGRFGDQLQVEQHPDREEEQAEQDRAEGLDVGLELVPVGRFGEHHAGDERAQRDRQMQRVHHRRRADDREQAGDDEQLALAEPSDQPEQGIEHEPADDDQRDRPRARCRAQASSPVGAVGSGGVRAIAAMIVIIGTIDRSWNSRIENARSPCGVFSSLSARSIGSTCAVDDRPSGSPIASAASGEMPSAK